MSETDPLLTPFDINGVTIKNRVVSTPHAPGFAEDGMPKERYQRYHEEKAIGGIGMTMFGGSSCVGPDSPSVFGQLNVGTDDVIPWLSQFSERIHRHDCRLICQISHLGRRTTWNAADWLPVIAPSRVREPAHRGFPKVMDQHDIDRVIGYYVAAAVRCREGGLDGIEILQNGHLPGQFLSPDLNQRSDKYGGSLENRMRFVFELYEAVRKAVGDDFVFGARIEMDSRLDEGLQLDESMTCLKKIQSSGLVNYFNMNVGRADTEYMLAQYQVPAMYQRLSPWLQLAGQFKQELDLPIIHATRISDLATARYAIEENLLDLVGMTRAHIADPHLMNKLRQGDEARIRPCVGAGYCIDRIYNEGDMVCTHNVATGREKTIAHVTVANTTQQRRVVVIGGGPAGMEAARVCAERGHRVTLLEASSELGGQIRIAAAAKIRKDIIGVSDWLEAELGHLKVDVQWNTFAEADTVLALEPDVVIVATGGLPDLDFASGLDRALSSWDVLTNAAPISGRVLVYDDHGQHQAASAIDHLLDKDLQLEVVTPDRHVCAEVGSTNFPMYLRNFENNQLKITPNYRLSKIEQADDGLHAHFLSDYGGHPLECVADHIVVEHGTVPNDELYQTLRSQSANDGVTDYDALLSGVAQSAPADDGFLLFRVGDAVASRNIHASIFDSRRLCQNL